MSHVTTVAIFCSCAEFGEDEWQRAKFSNAMRAVYGKGSEDFYRMEPLRDLSEGPLSRLWGGSKAPECDLWCGAINYCDHDALRAAFLAWPWEYPEKAILVYQCEDYDAVVVRAKDEPVLPMPMRAKPPEEEAR